MEKPHPITPAQSIVDAIIESASLVEAGRISLLARQGLNDPTSLTMVQARHVFAAFLLLFDPLVSLRDEVVPPNLMTIARLPLPGSRGSSAPGSLA